MTSEEVLEEIDALIDRTCALLDAGDTPSWKHDRDVLMSDIAEVAKARFDRNLVEFKRIQKAFKPRSKFISGSEWANFVRTYGEPVLRVLKLVRHRVDKGQTKLLQQGYVEQLIEPGTPHSAYVLLRDIVETACQQIFIVDPYVDRTLFSLLSNVAAGVEIRIITRQQNAPPDLLTEGNKFIQQTGAKIECRVGLSDFHDRFLLVDDRLFFSGASFKDLGKKESLVAEVEDIKDQILDELETRWNSASPLN